jgi:hypothetical protein
MIVYLTPNFLFAPGLQQIGKPKSKLVLVTTIGTIIKKICSEQSVNDSEAQYLESRNKVNKYTR